MHAVRDIGKADDAQLTEIQESVTVMLGKYEQFMGGDLVEALCLWREAVQRQLNRRPKSDAKGLALAQ